MIPNMPLFDRVLLFGGTGQIGWELANRLKPLGTVLTPGRSAADLSDAASVLRCIDDAKPSLIINAAAYTAVDAAEQNQGLATVINATAPGVMAEAAKRLGVPLIHYSTDYVFDGRPVAEKGGGLRPYRETDLPNPVNFYGQSKLDGDRAIQAVASAYLILRTGWVYSTRGQNFLLTIRRLAAEREELRVVDDQIGSPTPALAIAAATVDILKADPSTIGEASGCYHLSAAGSTSWYGFARAILESGGADSAQKLARLIGIPSRDYPTLAARPLYSVLDNSAVQASFGITMEDWRRGLHRVLETPHELS